MGEIKPIPPGATIKEQLKAHHITEKELAEKTGFSEQFIVQLIAGNIEITTYIAKRLEYALGVPAQFWINLKAIYREKQEFTK